MPSISAARTSHVHDHFLNHVYLFFLLINISFFYGGICFSLLLYCKYLEPGLYFFWFLLVVWVAADRDLLTVGVSSKYLPFASLPELFVEREQ